jgi:hypothetical protein
MLSVVEQRANQQRGLARFIGFFTIEAFGIMWGALQEWVALLAGVRHRNMEEVVAHDDRLPEDVRSAQGRVNAALEQMLHAISAQQFERARRWSDVEREERHILRRLLEKHGLGDEPEAI